MTWILRAIGWIGMITGLFNAGIKIFADDHAVRTFAGSSRNLDSNFAVIGFCLIFLALASILAELRKLNSSNKGASTLGQRNPDVPAERHT